MPGNCAKGTCQSLFNACSLSMKAIMRSLACFGSECLWKQQLKRCKGRWGICSSWTECILTVKNHAFSWKCKIRLTIVKLSVWSGGSAVWIQSATRFSKAGQFLLVAKMCRTSHFFPWVVHDYILLLCRRNLDSWSPTAIFCPKRVVCMLGSQLRWFVSSKLCFSKRKKSSKKEKRV